MIKYKTYRISKTLMRILKSELNVYQLNKLNKWKLLTNDEQAMVKRIMDNYSSLGHSGFYEIIKEYGFSDEFNEGIKEIEASKVDNYIYDFINVRTIHDVHRELNEVLLHSESLADYELKVQDVVTGKYLASVKRKNKTTYDELELDNIDTIKFPYKNSKYVRTYIGNIDNYIKGFYLGNVNTIVSNSKELRHSFLINQLYNLLIDGIKVCLISFEYNSRYILFELIKRHSYSRKFSQPFSLDDVDKEVYNDVYNDFKKYVKNLMICDEDDFVLIDDRAITRELIVADHELGKDTQVVMIEGTQNMRFDDGKKSLVKRNLVEYEYYTFFKKLAKNYLGTNGKVAVIISNSSNEIYDEDLNDSLMFKINHLSENSSNFSDTIIALRTSTSLANKNEVEISILKSVNEICVRDNYKFKREKYEFELVEKEAEKSNNKAKQYESYADNIKKEQVL